MDDFEIVQQGYEADSIYHHSDNVNITRKLQIY